MHQQISKYNIYLYIFFFIFLSSLFNFQFSKKYESMFKLDNINIYGLSSEDSKIIKQELIYFKNESIFKLEKNKILKRLNKFNFLENIYVNKKMPSSINIDLKKTNILGKTLINDEIFYIGKNGKFIDSKQLSEKKKIPMVFGEFKIIQFIKLLNTLNTNEIEINQIDEYYYFKNKRWNLKFSNGITLMLPSKNFENSLKIYKKLLKDNNLMNTKIIDFRVPNQIILTNNNE